MTYYTDYEKAGPNFGTEIFRVGEKIERTWAFLGRLNWEETSKDRLARYGKREISKKEVNRIMLMYKLENL